VFDDVHVDDADLPDAEQREALHDLVTESAGSDDEHMRGAQLRLVHQLMSSCRWYLPLVAVASSMAGAVIRR
jgi:hypothetical protein